MNKDELINLDIDQDKYKPRKCIVDPHKRQGYKKMTLEEKQAIAGREIKKSAMKVFETFAMAENIRPISGSTIKLSDLDPKLEKDTWVTIDMVKSLHEKQQGHALGKVIATFPDKKEELLEEARKQMEHPHTQ